ncbi:short-chain dehydrogenase [Sphingomonas sp. MM-1]|uniref:SDR family NAD(P)-dependent oxidoreductase n=1 Tax=Sphingomonas sp. MM-1 TaxID=745310 RepID=UPI0002C10436|nr:SDR family NAD(P)-dependent oxidoreductase [Sphingomonas sp. MM-1]AGH50580.1 short-chain dehydrogenase [Sphingomonas sp. MM-1]
MASHRPIGTAFITGANVGQGNLLAKRLADRGVRVFAGVLPGAPTDLEGDNRITLVEQDVSDGESVRKSAEIVDAALNGQGLDLLLNVAGVANIAVGVIEGVKMEEVERIFQINTFGQLRVIQAFLPMLRRAKAARIANYSSGAIIANPVGSGPYNMTKHAIHGMTLTLRHELAAFGIQVTSILPGGVLTGMSANAHANTLKTWHAQPDAVLAVYDKPLGNTVKQVLPDMLEKSGSTPDEAVDQMMAILDQPKWKPISYVGKDVKPMGLMRRLLSDSQLEKAIRSTFKIPTAKIPSPI